MIRKLKNSSNTVDILFVDDDPDDAKLTIHALTMCNLSDRLLWVKDGLEALNFIFGCSEDPIAPVAQKPRLILLDLKLPKVNGHQVLERIKSDPRTRTIPVVVFSCSRDIKDIQWSYRYGVNSYIVKPTVFENFIDVIKHMAAYWIQLNQPY